VWTVVKILIDYWYITVPTIALIIIYAKIKSNRAKAKKDSKSAWHEREEWTDYINADDESAWHDPLKDKQQSAWGYQYTQEEKDKDQENRKNGKESSKKNVNVKNKNGMKRGKNSVVLQRNLTINSALENITKF